jgi:hypothetical protein
MKVRDGRVLKKNNRRLDPAVRARGTRKGSHAGRGESYAKAYANRVLDQVWPAYALSFRI